MPGISRRLSAAAVAFLAGAAAIADPLQTIGTGNTLLTVNSAAPATVVSSVAVTGVAAGTTLRGIDYRPATPRVLYAVSNVGQLYAINARTGSAAAVGAAPAVAPISAIGLDFNPTVDRIRLVTQIGQNVRINPDTGALAATDGSLAYAAGDPSFGQIPTAAGAAYTNNVAGATSTTFYLIDTRGGLAPARLVTQGNLSGTVSPNSGTLFTVGSTGVASASSVGFDIARDGTAYATLTNPANGVTSLYQINLVTGAATLIGVLAGNTTYVGLAVQLASFSSMGLTANQAAVGAALDSFTGLPRGGVLALFNGIDGVYATPGAQAAALQQLSPAAFASLPALSLNGVEVQEAGILRYLRDRRQSGTGAGSSAVPLDADGRLSAWLTGGSRYGRYNVGRDRFRASSDDAHVLGGVDYRPVDAITLGAFGGYSGLDAGIGPNGSRGRLGSLFGGGYASVAVGAIHLDGWASYTDLDWRLNRNLAIGTFTDATAARTDGRIYSVGGVLGLDLRRGAIDVEPFAGLRYTDTLIHGFTETGGAAALTVGRFGGRLLRSLAGARIGTRFELAGATFRPQVRGGWYHEFGNRDRTIAAAFVDSSIATPFLFRATPLRADYYNAGGTLTVVGRGPVSMVADYDVQFAADRRYNSFTIGLRLAM